MVRGRYRAVERDFLFSDMNPVRSQLLSVFTLKIER